MCPLQYSDISERISELVDMLPGCAMVREKEIQMGLLIDDVAQGLRLEANRLSYTASVLGDAARLHAKNKYQATELGKLRVVIDDLAKDNRKLRGWRLVDKEVRDRQDAMIEKLQEETGEQSVAIGQLRAMVDGKQELIVSLEARNTALHVEIGKLGHFDVERADLAERVSDLLIGKARMHDVIDKQAKIICVLRRATRE